MNQQINRYQYSLEECDVRCAKCLTRFRTKRDEWLSWLNEDEYHAISRQIYAMLWSDAVFRLVNESRKHAHKAGDRFATHNSILAEALDRGYVSEQLTAFRRLSEKAARDPKRQVVSLRRLIDDVKDHREILTREMFVCYDGLPFEGQMSNSDFNQLDGNSEPFTYLDATGPRAFDMAELQNQSFDKMMNGKPENRGRDDLIGNQFFDEIETVLSEAPFDKAQRYANKIILHGADSGSRGHQNIEALCLDDFWSCHRAILQTANRISLAIGGSNIGGVPTPQFDVLENWDAPFAPVESFDEMLDEWGSENQKREDWTQKPLLKFQQ